jgi:N6-adenosine-specific RNA methylase IME4
MKDPIVQEVREARAAVSADFGFDLHKFFAWAKTHTAAEKKAKHWLPTSPNNKTLENTGGAVQSPVARKRRVRPSGVSA